MQSDNLTARLKKAEVCAELGISLRTLDNLVLTGQFPPGVRIGKFCFWSRVVLQRWGQREFAVQEAWRPL